MSEIIDLSKFSKSYLLLVAMTAQRKEITIDEAIIVVGNQLAELVTNNEEAA